MAKFLFETQLNHDIKIVGIKSFPPNQTTTVRGKIVFPKQSVALFKYFYTKILILI